jgi:hypothetical protein
MLILNRLTFVEESSAGGLMMTMTITNPIVSINVQLRPIRCCMQQHPRRLEKSVIVPQKE